MAGTVVVETAMFAAATWLYATGTRARDGVGRWAFAAWIGVLGVIYVGNIFSPPPPDIRSLSLVALLLWLFPIWAWWFDAHRSAAAGVTTPSDRVEASQPARSPKHEAGTARSRARSRLSTR